MFLEGRIDGEVAPQERRLPFFGGSFLGLAIGTDCREAWVFVGGYDTAAIIWGLSWLMLLHGQKYSFQQSW